MEINSIVRIGYPFGYIDSDPCFVRGESIFVFDQTGKKYMDLCSGLWNMPFGYSNMHIEEKAVRQMKELPYTNLIQNQAEIQLSYAGRLCRYLGDFKSILYTNSGSEAIEAAIKTCRKYQVIRGNEKCRSISAFTGSYHGTSYGAMSISGIDREFALDYHPMLPQINWITIPDDPEDASQWIEILTEHFGKNSAHMAGVIAEPVMASGGIIKIPDPAIRKLRQLCDEEDKLLVMDEVAVGFGRIGLPFTFQGSGIIPDLVCMAKAINNGYLPLGALAFSDKAADTFGQANEGLEHFSTQGGNLVAIAAADAVLDLMRDYESYKVSDKGNLMLHELKKNLAGVDVNVRGFGLMAGIEFAKSVNEQKIQEILVKLKKIGILVYAFNNPGFNKGISIFPPYIINEEQMTDAFYRLSNVLKRAL